MNRGGERRSKWREMMEINFFIGDRERGCFWLFAEWIRLHGHFDDSYCEQRPKVNEVKVRGMKVGGRESWRINRVPCNT